MWGPRISTIHTMGGRYGTSENRIGQTHDPMKLARETDPSEHNNHPERPLGDPCTNTIFTYVQDI